VLLRIPLFLKYNDLQIFSGPFLNYFALAKVVIGAKLAARVVSVDHVG
jgi:hypothetical protein